MDVLNSEAPFVNKTIYLFIRLRQDKKWIYKEVNSITTKQYVNLRWFVADNGVTDVFLSGTL
jgi:hypothetical protein